MGGYAGIATNMGFAVEFQADSTPHAHGFVSLANMYQHNTLFDIARMLTENCRKWFADDIVDGVSREPMAQGTFPLECTFNDCCE